MRQVRVAARSRAGLCVVVVLAVLSGACGRSTEVAGPDPTTSSTGSAGGPVPSVLPEPVQTLDIDATEYKFEFSPDPSGGLMPGWTLLRFHNIGAEAHQVMFARIKDGVDMSTLAAAGAGDSSGAGAIAFVDMIGGVSYIDRGHDITAMVDLTAGTTMAMCYVPDAHGVAHALMGMTATLPVSAATDPPGSSVPTTSDAGQEDVRGTIELSADGYVIPDDLGDGWYHVKNTDSALHELSLMRLDHPIDEDQSRALVEDLAANKTPQVGVEAVGGMGAISPGFDGYLYLDLEPGSYLAVDFMPDPGQPRPHMLDGYHRTFVV